VERETFQGFQIDRENFKFLSILRDSFKSGAYQLLMELSHPAEIEVGKLGLIYFPQGHYLYTGVHRTALIARVLRHLRNSKKIHWHIDYLTTDTSLSIRQIFLYPDELGECRINRKFLEISEAKILHPGFGSSDCKNKCAGHLLFLERGEKQLKVWREKYLDVSYRFKNGESIQIISNKS
jgi:Uri superfamily endonuclease